MVKQVNETDTIQVYPQEYLIQNTNDIPKCYQPHYQFVLLHCTTKYDPINITSILGI